MIDFLDTLLTKLARKTDKYLIGQKIKSIIKQRYLSGGVAQSVRAQDS